MPSKKFNQVEDNGDGTFSVIGGKPRDKKKLTATRFAKVLGLNTWNTPFQAWCEIMKVAEEPFSDNKYTIAGKFIEPLLLEFCRESISPFIQSPEDYYPDKRTRPFWDYFPNEPVFGGKWDGLVFERDNVIFTDEDKPVAVIEAKTSSRPQDWEDGVPAYYALQGLAYAYKLGVDDVYFPVTFLSSEDYPRIVIDEHGVCSQRLDAEFVVDDDNTRIFHMKTSDKVEGKTIAEWFDVARIWWKEHINANTSPKYDDKRDKSYLDIIGTVDIAQTPAQGDLEDLLEQLNKIDSIIHDKKESIDLYTDEELRKGLVKEINAVVKPMLKDIKGKDILDTTYYEFKISPSRSTDYKQLEEDGLLDKYVTVSQSIRSKRKV